MTAAVEKYRDQVREEIPRRKPPRPYLHLHVTDHLGGHKCRFPQVEDEAQPNGRRYVGPRFIINRKRSSQKLQLSTRSPAEYAIYREERTSVRDAISLATRTQRLEHCNPRVDDPEPPSVATRLTVSRGSNGVETNRPDQSFVWHMPRRCGRSVLRLRAAPTTAFPSPLPVLRGSR